MENPESMASENPTDGQVEQINTPQVDVGQALPSDGSTVESFTDVDPSTLPPELQDLWNKTYKSLQGDYTKKTMGIADLKTKAEAYEELLPYLEQIMQQPEQQKEQPTGEDILARIKEDPTYLDKLVEEKAKQLVDPLYQERNMAEATKQYNDFLENHPDLPEHEDVMIPLVTPVSQGGKGLSLEEAYKVATYDKVLQKGIDKGAETVKKRDGAASPQTSTAPVRSDKRPRTYDEAYQLAREQTGWTG